MNSEEFIRLCLANNIEDVTITINTIFDSLIEMHKDEVHKEQTMNITTYIIKATFGDNTITINSEYLDESLIEDIKEVAEYTENKHKDEVLEKKQIKANGKFKKETVYSFKDYLVKAYKLTQEEKYCTFYLQQIEYKAINKKIINSNGLSLESNNSYYEYACEITSKKEGEEAVVDSKIIVVKDKKDLNILGYTKEVVLTNKMHLDKKNIKSGKYKILFKESVVKDLVEYFVSMLNGNSVNKGITMLKDSLNKKEFSDKLTIVENPLDEFSPSYRLFDDEGTETSKKILLDKGIVKSFLYDNKNAKEANKESSGNSYNGGIDVKNVYLEKGTSSYEDLIKEMNDGIIINEVMVSSNATNINTGVYTGEISSGFLVHNGKIVSSINNVIFVTDLKEIFNNIIDIGDKLVYTTPNISTPCLLVDNIMITGAEDNEN